MKCECINAKHGNGRCSREAMFDLQTKGGLRLNVCGPCCLHFEVEKRTRLPHQQARRSDGKA